MLGVAFRSDDADDSGLNLEKDLVWVGLVGMADPIRPEAPDLIDAFRHAGITSVMLTGDQRSTAAAVAAKIGLSDGRAAEIVDARRLDEYARRIPRGARSRACLCARCTGPEAAIGQSTTGCRANGCNGRGRGQ